MFHQLGNPRRTGPSFSKIRERSGAVLFLILLLAALPAAAQPTHTVTLTWSWTQGNGGLATGYAVFRAPATGTTCPAAGSSSFVQIGTVSTEATMTYVDTSSSTNTLTEGATYCYEVTATDSAGSSPDSNVASATIPFSVPVAPTGLAATAK